VQDADAGRVVLGATARTSNPADGQPVPLTVAAAPRHGSAPAGQAVVRLAFRDAAPVPVDASVEVEIDAEEHHDVVFVPQEAVLQVDGDTLVMLATGDRAERRRVVTGATSQGRIAITAGVRAGDLVIVRGHVGLPDGALISVAIDRR